SLSHVAIWRGDQRRFSLPITASRNGPDRASRGIIRDLPACSTACACAHQEEYRPSRCGSAVRAISRLIVDGARLSRAAIARIDSPRSRPLAICSRSNSDNRSAIPAASTHQALQPWIDSAQGPHKSLLIKNEREESYACWARALA